MSYSIELDHQNKLIRYKHSGVITKNDIGQAWQEFLQMDEFTKMGYNLLSDYTEAKFNMELDEVNQITEFLHSIKAILNGKKQALIVNDPYNTVISVLFEGDVNHKVGFNVKTFSTQKSAFNWLV
jgi:hypothetical protein